MDILDVIIQNKCNKNYILKGKLSLWEQNQDKETYSCFYPILHIQETSNAIKKKWLRIGKYKEECLYSQIISIYT